MPAQVFLFAKELGSAHDAHGKERRITLVFGRFESGLIPGGSWLWGESWGSDPIFGLEDRLSLHGRRPEVRDSYIRPRLFQNILKHVDSVRSRQYEEGHTALEEDTDGVSGGKPGTTYIVAYSEELAAKIAYEHGYRVREDHTYFGEGVFSKWKRLYGHQRQVLFKA